MLISHHHFPIERPSLDVSTIFQIIYCWFVVSRERSLLCHISTGYNADTCWYLMIPHFLNQSTSKNNWKITRESTNPIPLRLNPPRNHGFVMFSRGVTHMGQFRRSLVLGWDYHWKTRGSNWLPIHAITLSGTSQRPSGVMGTIAPLGDLEIELLHVQQMVIWPTVISPKMVTYWCVLRRDGWVAGGMGLLWIIIES